MNIVTRMSRQADIVKGRLGSLLIIGAGGIGSNALQTALSLGVTDIGIVDFDSVQEENIFPGWFGEKQIGKQKVAALAQSARRDYGVRIKTFDGSFDDPKIAEAIDKWADYQLDAIIASTDSNETRWRAFWMLSRHCQWWIDTRMGGTLASVRVFHPRADDGAVQWYEEYCAQSDPPLLCGLKATAPLTKGYLPGMIGTVLVAIANGMQPPAKQVVNMSSGILLRPERPEWLE